MANNVITSSIIVNETLRIAHNQSAFLGSVNTQYADKFGKTGAKVGSTINARLPVQWTIRTGPVANIQDVNETTVPITVQPEIGIDWAFSEYDLALSVDEFSDRYLMSAGAKLATAIDVRIAALFAKVYNFSGTPGATPGSALAALNAKALLQNNASPKDSQYTLAMDPITNASMVDGTKGLLNPASIGNQTREGMMKTLLGMDYQMSQNVPSYTVGALGGTPLVNGANQGVINAGATDNPTAATTSLVTNGWTAAAAQRLNAGDVITIAGVFAVNSDNKQNLGVLQQFVVTANASSDGAGNLTAIIAPAIVAGGAYQNVTVRPASGAAITVVSGTAGQTYMQNLLYHKDAIAFATVDMEPIKGMDMYSQAEYNGVNLRFVRGYDIVNNRRICRFDILAAYQMVRPEWAVRLTR